MKTDSEIIRAIIQLQGDVKASEKASSGERARLLSKVHFLLCQAENGVIVAGWDKGDND